jgi:CubicO group peptidase (beta-lactamase class C family)
MKVFKKIFYFFIGLIVLLIAAALLTGNMHIFKAVSATYLSGQSGPSQDDKEKFYNNTIKASEQSIVWKKSKNYNTSSIGTDELKLMRIYKPSAFIIVKKDSLLFEKYWEDHGENSVTNSFSMAKSFVGLLIGKAIEENLISSLDQRASDFLPEWKNNENENVTIKQLLTMTSNIAFDEDYSNAFGYQAKVYYGSNLREETMAFKLVGQPGKTWEYLGGNTIALSLIIEKATGKSVSEYFYEKIWSPIGAEADAYWSTDTEDGIEKSSCCFYARARDFAKIGQLCLDSGRVNGKQIINKKYLAQSFSPVNIPDKNGNLVNYYGYQWWLTSYKGLQVNMARGILGQYIIIVPEKEIVIVRLGNGRSEKYINEFPTDVFLYLDIALKMI